MIRHEQVNMSWRKKYNSITFDQACVQYDKASIVTSHKECSTEKSGEEVYISQLPRTYETASRLFDRQDFYKTALLNEVPLRSFKDTDREYPLWLWFFMGRLQWFLQKKKRGYRIRYGSFRARMFGISNLERIAAEISTEK